MEKKVILFIVTVACVAALIAISQWEPEGPPLALPSTGPSGPGGPTHGPSAQAGKNAPAPDFALSGARGEKIKLSDLKGKVVLINFWKVGCPACQMQMPSLMSLESALAGKPFKLITVMVGAEVSEAKQIADRYGWDFTILVDPDGEVAQLYNIMGTPTNYIIDPAGNVNNYFVGYMDFDDASAVDYFNSMFQGPAPAAPKQEGARSDPTDPGPAKSL